MRAERIFCARHITLDWIGVDSIGNTFAVLLEYCSIFESLCRYCQYYFSTVIELIAIRTKQCLYFCVTQERNLYNALLTYTRLSIVDVPLCELCDAVCTPLTYYTFRNAFFSFLLIVSGFGLCNKEIVIINTKSSTLLMCVTC